MNKFGFAAIALVVASACVISAAPKGGHEGHHGHEHGHKHLSKSVGPVEEREEYEISHHEPHHGSKHIHKEPIHPIQHHGHQCHCPEYHHEHEQSFHVPKHFNKHHGGHQGGFRGRSGNAFSSSSSGDLEKSRGSLRAHEDEREHLHADNNRFSHKHGAKGVIAGHVNKDHHEDTGIKKHQKVNTDKTIIVDKGTAVNDLEVNRHSHDHKGAGGFAAGAAGSKSEAANSRFDLEKERERDVEAQSSQFRDRESETHDF